MRKPPEILDTPCYTESVNRKGHRSPEPTRPFPGTVSRCSPHCGHPPRAASPSSGRLKAGPTRTDCGTRLQTCRVAIRGDIVGTGSQPVQRRHSCRRPNPSNQRLGKKTVHSQPLFVLLLRAAVEVRSTGARGASHKTSRKCKEKRSDAGTLHKTLPAKRMARK